MGPSTALPCGARIDARLTPSDAPGCPARGSIHRASTALGQSFRGVGTGAGTSGLANHRLANSMTGLRAASSSRPTLP